MMSKSITPRSTDISDWSDADLRSELAAQLSLTASSLSRAALIWTELTRRGADLSALRAGLALYLPRIARGELAAEAVVAFAGQRMLLQHIVGMPLDEQRRYAAGERILVAERDETGQIIGIEKIMANLTGREVLLAVADGKVRPIRAQTLTLARLASRPTRRRAQTGSVAKVKAQDGLVHVGRTRLDPQDLAPALKALGFDLIRREEKP